MNFDVDSEIDNYYIRKNELIDVITGASGFKKSYYAELKKRLQEVKNKNLQLEKVFYSLENVSQLINSVTKELEEVFIGISKIIISVFKVKYVIFFLNNEIYKAISTFIIYNSKRILYYSSIPKNFQTILDYIADKSELYIN
ncbi:MAG: hypothetical protein C0173_01605, partial [Desulfurella sp.]